MSEITSSVAMLDVGASMPEYIKKLDTTLQMTWKDAYTQAAQIFGYEKALEIANRVVLKKLKKMAAQPRVDASEEVITEAAIDAGVIEDEEVEEVSLSERVSLNLDPSNEVLVSCAENGDVILEAVLADNKVSSDGKQFTNEALISMADFINKNGMALPDIDHAEFDKLAHQFPNIEEFKAQLKSQKGIFKSVKAFFNKGKLMIKAFLDKRYRKIAQKYKSLSIEAIGQLDDTNPDLYVDAEPLSFTFTNTPKIAGADVLSVQ
jgi:hypothetical protein